MNKQIEPNNLKQFPLKDMIKPINGALNHRFIGEFPEIQCDFLMNIDGFYNVYCNVTGSLIGFSNTLGMVVNNIDMSPLKIPYTVTVCNEYDTISYD